MLGRGDYFTESLHRNAEREGEENIFQKFILHSQLQDWGLVLSGRGRRDLVKAAIIKTLISEFVAKD